MALLLTGLLTLVCCGLLLWGTVRRERIYEFPFLAGAVVAGWILPQAIGLIGDPFLPADGLEMALVMTILCAGMCYLGYVWKAPGPFWPQWDFDMGRLEKGAAALTLFGGGFYVALSRLPEEQITATQYEGTPVAFLFFADTLAYGFAISLLIFSRTSSRLALMLALIGSSFYLERIIFSGRRGDVVQLVLMVLLAAWFQRKKTIPLPAMIGALLLGALEFNNIDQYRAMVLSNSDRDWAKVSEIDYLGGMETLAKEGGEEFKNAVYNIAATQAATSYDFGIFHWNMLVFNYVPAQLVGQDLKEALTLDMPQPALSNFGYAANVGATETGMSDAFGSFWFFGALKFFFIAAVMGIIFRAASSGDIVAQIFYMVMAPNALHAITHHTQWFLSPWVHMIIFLYPVLYYARVAGQQPGTAAGSPHHERVDHV